MGVRTIFNLLGPLTNPAGAPNQMLGVFSPQWVEPIAHVLERLGSEHVLVAHAEDGLDEISIGAPTKVAELHNGEVKTYTVRPEDFGMRSAPISTLAVESVEDSLSTLTKALENQDGPARDVVALNAGAAIYAAGLTPDLKSGIQRAVDVLADGSARERLDALVEFTAGL